MLIKTISITLLKNFHSKVQLQLILLGAACICDSCIFSDLPDKEREKIIQEVCRHRCEFAFPSTPNHFWEIGIPSTAECKKRGTGWLWYELGRIYWSVTLFFSYLATFVLLEMSICLVVGQRD